MIPTCEWTPSRPDPDAQTWLLDIALWQSIARYAAVFRRRWPTWESYAKEVRYAKGAIVALELLVREADGQRIPLAVTVDTAGRIRPMRRAQP